MSSVAVENKNSIKTEVAQLGGLDRDGQEVITDNKYSRLTLVNLTGQFLGIVGMTCTRENAARSNATVEGYRKEDLAGREPNNDIFGVPILANAKIMAEGVSEAFGQAP